MKSYQHFFLIHQYAGNKGDRAVLFSLCRILRQINPTCKICVSTSSPELWSNDNYFLQNNIIFVPSGWDYQREPKHNIWRKFIKKFKKYTFTIMRESTLLGFESLIGRFFINSSFWQALQSSDIVISVGGHHFTTLLSKDLVSSINFDALSVTLAKKVFICFSQSFGPFNFYNRRNKLLTYFLLSHCQYLYTRENSSIQYLKEFNIPDDIIKKTFETVITLNSVFKNFILPSKRKSIIGISIYCTQKRTTKELDSYINTFVTFCKHVISKQYKIYFFPMELKDSPPDDRPIINKIIDHVNHPTVCSLIDEDMDTETHIKMVSECQIFIGHKTHSTIFALTCGTPLIGIAYHPKTREFMNQYHVGQYCLDDNQLNPNNLINIFNNLENNIDSVGKSEFDISKDISKLIIEDLKNIINS